RCGARRTASVTRRPGDGTLLGCLGEAQGLGHGGRCLCQSVRDWYSRASRTSFSSSNARVTKLSPVGRPFSPNPLGTLIPGTPTTLLEPISDTPPFTSGYASRNALSSGLATVARVGVATASNG